MSPQELATDMVQHLQFQISLLRITSPSNEETPQAEQLFRLLSAERKASIN